jgi:membrane associated rhomboid family serine protease
MLIVPVSGKIGWKNPPVATLILLVVNCIVFLVFQLQDNENRIAAEQYYFSSGLAEIEIPIYLDYLEATGGTMADPPDIEAMDAETAMEVHLAMEDDAAFLERLTDGRIIPREDARYALWKSSRLTYERHRNQSTAFSYGLRPAYPRPTAFFTYMFLHGSVGHLIGNMIFLWILGCMLEIGAGRGLFLTIYLASGLAAAALFCAVYPSSTTPLVGASGAIAGLMGAYTVLFGKTRVNVFYSLGFYFDTVKIPAILLLPLWLTNEAYQLFFSDATHVAYVAHIGGIVAGAMLALAGNRWIRTVDQNSFKESPDKQANRLMHQALEHMGQLEMMEAETLLGKVLDLSPDNPDALKHLFNIHKLNPQSEAFHDTARRRLRVLLQNRSDHAAAVECYTTYAEVARRPVLSIPLYLQVAGAMVTAGNIGGAEKIILAIMKKQPQTPGLPSSLVKLSQAFRQKGRHDRWEDYRRLIRKRYPDSAEAAIILKADGSR